jgi:hypothetical protein
MNDLRAYSIKSSSWCMLYSSYVFLFLVFFLNISFAQDVSAQEPEYDEIPVFLEVPGVGGTEISAVIMGEELFLPVTELFNFLKVKNISSSGLETISGFFISPEMEYAISRTDNSIVYQGKTNKLDQGDLVRTETNLYLRASYFGKVFGLDCMFSFRSLSVKLTSKLELPIIREMKQEEMRRNLSRLKGEIKADTNIKRTYPVFRFGMADWSAIATEEVNGRTDTRLNLSLGAMVAGGEATALLNYNTTDPFSERQQYYLWRYVDNDYRFFKQAMVGKINTQSTSTIFNPVIGVQLTNTPTTYRRSFGTYTLSDRTEPGWIVELYVNNVLIDYMKADASGFFKFEVPLVYGNSIIQLKFFGPWGEEKVREQNINIPFNFLPEKTFEYRVSGGFVEDSSLSRFSRASFSYGVSRTLTVGAGMEYLSSLKVNPAMPYVNASWSLLNNILLSGEYTYGVRAKGTLSYRLPSNIQVDLNYTKYDKDQKAIFYNYLEERKASLALPLKFRHFSSYNRLAVHQIILPASKYTTGEWMFSGAFLGVSTNLTTYALFIGNTRPYVYSNLSLSLRLPANYVVMPQAQYGFTANEFISARVSIEKRIKDRAFLNLSFEQNFNNNLRMGEVGFRYNFNFAQTGVSVRQGNHTTSFIEYARGSLLYDRKTNFLGADNQFNVGKGGISVIPFLDLNANGLRDKGEPKAYGLNLRANGGRIEKSESDTTIRILGLEPYTNCYIELDANSFENVSWRLPVKILGVAVDPNILKHIEIPVTVVGEASGTVSLIKDGESAGIGRIVVSFFDSRNKHVTSTLTEDDGYYSWFGLVPGQYSVRIDSSQVNKLNMISDPIKKEFRIGAGMEGDIADGLDFRLSMIKADSAKTQKPVLQQIVKKDTSFVIVHEITQELVTISKDSWAIQLGAFRSKANADNLRRKLEKILGRKVEIIIEDNFFKVRINDIGSRKETDEIIEILRKNGITEVWVISLKAKQQQVIVKEVQDSMMTVADTRYFRAFGNDFYKLETGKQPFLDPVILDLMKTTKTLNKPLLEDLRLRRKPDEERTPKIERVIPVQKILNVIDIPSFESPIKERNLKKPMVASMPQPDIIVPARAEPVIAMPSEEANAAKPEPAIAIQVAIFYKKSEALRAQRRITSKLNLPVEIVEQWEFFRVIIPGFYTREETYRYYPELAGLGYPGVTIIERK